MKSQTAIRKDNPRFLEHVATRYAEPVASTFSRGGNNSYFILLILAMVPVVNIVWLVSLLLGSEHTLIFLILNTLGAIGDVVLGIYIMTVFALGGLLFGSEELIKSTGRVWIAMGIFLVIVILNILGFFGVFPPVFIALGSLVSFVLAPLVAAL